MSQDKRSFGIIGLGNMGRNFALNLADRGVPLGVYNRSGEKTEHFMRELAGDRDITAARTPAELVQSLDRPRTLLLIVSAGKPVDAVLGELVLLLDPEDLVIDGGNSHFRDTDRRAGMLAERSFLYLGMGISGGESGARHGPSLMPGGDREGYDRVADALAKAAAQVHGEPCVAYLGQGSAGHYVKMVHNGIEYAFMQLLSESYDLLGRGLGLSAAAMQPIYQKWNQGPLSSYLLEITAAILGEADPEAPGPLVDHISDRASQKGTGRWTSDQALELQIPTPAIDLAVVMRNLSTHDTLRGRLAAGLGQASPLDLDQAGLVADLEDALRAGLILAFAQGMSLLWAASQSFGYHLDLETVSRIWRGGCIIRAELLEKLRRAYKAAPDLESLLLDPELAQEVTAATPGLRRVVSAACLAGLPVPGLAASLAYLDALRSLRLPTNLVQAQRDYFGGHTYERSDRPGSFHHAWEEAAK
ncbi:MAG: NADP-dependent phosphogluconate dehydrogenase [Deltaproteobacteria bacterium]|nr:NADP-dependent phosphogluconate dehydrogenase [Deltaproteobacteria bacterium]